MQARSIATTREAVLEAVIALARRRYGVSVRFADVAPPYKGDLDGLEIRIDPSQTADEALFMVAHLFGHTVQWNTSQRARVIGTMVANDPSESLLTELELYEREGAQFGLQLLLEAGGEHLAQWYSDYSACDFRYLRHYYATGEKLPFMGFWQSDSERLSPSPIPPFKPQIWNSGRPGIVI
jgi:hypothetical protein